MAYVQHARTCDRQPVAVIVRGRWGKEGLMMRRQEVRDPERYCKKRSFLIYCCNMNCLFFFHSLDLSM